MFPLLYHILCEYPVSIFLILFYNSTTMFTNSSPWLFQLNRVRPVSPLADDAHADITIIGGGIAGVVTAYFILKNTKKNVLLIEAHKVAHGATGHNAGQVTTYFERPIADIAKEYGLEMALEGQASVDSAWGLLEDIYQDANLKTPLMQFTGYAGCGSFESILLHLKDIASQIKGGINKEAMLIAQEASCVKDIPKKYDHCYTLLPHKDILSLLETNNPHYIAALSKRKGCLNSALFTEELVGYLIFKYNKRFSLAEHAPVKEVVLRKNNAVLLVENKFVVTKHVILCTNGFEKISIINTEGRDIDKKFHEMVLGSIGYMAGYLDHRDLPPTAISYLPDSVQINNTQESDLYFYLTRRPFENEKKEKHNLICLGGPEVILPEGKEYAPKQHPYPKEAQQQIDSFLKKNYTHAPKKISHKFLWHGLMGYTPTGIRSVGFEPRNPVLMYNLGCNGVGIMPSIYGGKRIADLLTGKKLKKSIFDPRG